MTEFALSNELGIGVGVVINNKENNLILGLILGVGVPALLIVLTFIVIVYKKIYNYQK